ncbi:trypsin-like peptidase domain-containing protein [Mahella sp.]|uniref:S1C family serine protease n=1 Tax=Mahella sp. TaxID=2798721 RepID=UPI0025C3A2D6|nr:trypsin-like peptidase domain-containing protein [Mahella sp.]MBZ4664954.1 peptidase and chymotrypsin/Hap [Mahella sp.]
MLKSKKMTIFVTALVSIALSFVVFTLLMGYNKPPVQLRQSPAPEEASADDDALGGVNPIVQKVAPAVVGISTTRVTETDMFGRAQQMVQGVGSGVIVDSDGYILTNDHVVGGETESINVVLSDGRTMEGRALWSDPVLDLAVVKIEGSGYTKAAFGDSDTLKVGEPAIAIGTPLGLQFQHTVTSGIISALNRTLQVEADGATNFMEDLIQTDASINPGNSGGPLINAKAQVVGINTVKVATAEGMGFAIPINIAKPIVERVIATGTFTAPYIGIFAYDREIANFIQNGPKLEQGVYVIDVDRNSPADKAGIKQGDIILSIDGKQVNTMLALRRAIYSRDIGDTVEIETVSNGNKQKVEVKLASRPEQ